MTKVARAKSTGHLRHARSFSVVVGAVHYILHCAYTVLRWDDILTAGPVVAHFGESTVELFVSELVHALCTG